MNSQTIQVIDSWDLTSLGIIAELRHELNGLTSRSILKSQSTSHEWRIMNRILFNHTIESQTRFLNETTALIHSSFAGVENMINSEANILGKEKLNIFQYQLQALGHNSKPQRGDFLLPVIMKRFPCPCCGYKTLDHEANGSYDICTVCFWEDDPIQLGQPDYEGGANPMSLRHAQHNFLEFGACDRNMLQNVRRPLADEQRDDNWKPLGEK
jgi:hypothetical protein